MPQFADRMIGSSDIYVAPVVDCMSHGLELPRLSRMGLRAELIDGRGGGGGGGGA